MPEPTAEKVSVSTPARTLPYLGAMKFDARRWSTPSGDLGTGVLSQRGRRRAIRKCFMNTPPRSTGRNGI